MYSGDGKDENGGNEVELELDIEFAPQPIDTSGPELDLEVEEPTIVNEDLSRLKETTKIDEDDLEEIELELELNQEKIQEDSTLKSESSSDLHGETDEFNAKLNRLQAARKLTVKPEELKKYLTNSLNEVMDLVRKYADSVSIDSSEEDQLSKEMHNYMMSSKPATLPPSMLSVIRPYIADGYEPKDVIVHADLEQYIRGESDRIQYLSYIKKLKEYRCKAGMLSQKIFSQKERLIEKLVNTNMSDENWSIRVVKSNTNFGLVKEIVVEDANKYKCVCGTCDEVIESKHPLFHTTLIPNESFAKQLVVCPDVLLCENCGTVLSLTEQEFTYLKKACQEEYRAKTSTFLSKSTSIFTGFNVTKYTPSKLFLSERLPYIYKIAIKEEEVKEEIVETIDISDALKRYKMKLNHFRSTIEQVGIPVGDLTNIVMINKMFSNILGYDYFNIKENAIYSLVTYINENSILYNNLSFKNLSTTKALMESINLLNLYSDMDLKDLAEVVELLCINLSIPYVSIVRDNKLDELVYGLLSSQIRAKLPSLEERLSNFKEHQEDVIQNLLECSESFSYVPISNISSLEYGILENILYDERVAKFLNETSELMLINHMAEEIEDYWVSKKGNIVANPMSTIKDERKELSDFKTNLDKLVKNLDKEWLSVMPNKNITYGRFEDYFNSYFITKGIDVDFLFPLSRMKEALIEYDTFKFMNALVKSKPLLSDEFKLDQFKQICSFIEQYIQIASEFVSNFGSSSKEHISYVLQGQFKLEEICDKKYIDELRIHKILKRKDNESYEEYIDRYNSTDFERVSVLELVPVDFSFFDSITEYIPCIISASLSHKFYISGIKSFNRFLVMRDFLYNCKYINIDKVIYALGLNKKFANLLSKVEGMSVEVDIDKARKCYLDSILANSIYEDEDLRDLVSEDDIDAEIAKKIIANQDALQFSLKMFSDATLELLKKYYSIEVSNEHTSS